MPHGWLEEKKSFVLICNADACFKEWMINFPRNTQYRPNESYSCFLYLLVSTQNQVFDVCRYLSISRETESDKIRSNTFFWSSLFKVLGSDKEKGLNCFSWFCLIFFPFRGSSAYRVRLEFRSIFSWFFRRYGIPVVFF